MSNNDRNGLIRRASSNGYQGCLDRIGEVPIHTQPRGHQPAQLQDQELIGYQEEERVLPDPNPHGWQCPLLLLQLLLVRPEAAALDRAFLALHPGSAVLRSVRLCLLPLDAVPSEGDKREGEGWSPSLHGVQCAHAADGDP